MRPSTLRLVGAFTGFLALASCQGSDSNIVTPPTGSIALTLTGTNVTVAQGASGTMAVTLTRIGGYTGAVDLTVEGAPTGVTAAFAPATIPAGATTSTLSVAVSSAVAAGSYTLTIRGHGSNVSDYTVPLTLIVTAVAEPGFTMSVSPASVSIAQGASTTVSVAIVRAGAFTAGVELTASGAPSGLSVTPSTVTVTGVSQTLTVTATSVAAGNYTVSLRGTAPGVAAQTVNLAVQVTGSSAGTAVIFQFCNDLPVWIGARNENGTWTQLTPTGQSGGFREYTFNLGSFGAVAVVDAPQTEGRPRGTVYQTTIMYATAGELFGLGQATIIECLSAESPRQLSGTIAGMTNAHTALIQMGAGEATIHGTSTSSFTVNGALSSDLIAARQTTGLTGIATDRLIFRRQVNLPDGGTIPLLDFGSAEAVAPATASVTLVGIGGDIPGLQSTFFSGALTTIDLGTTVGTSPLTAYGIPASKTNDEDMHQLVAIALTSDGAASRGAVSFSRNLSDRSLTLGTALANPTITAITTFGVEAPQRLRAQLAVQSEYSRAFSAGFSDASDSREVTVLATAGYREASSATAWDVIIPDLSAAGYDANWGLGSSAQVNWTVLADNSSSLLPMLEFVFPALDGTTYAFASRTNAPATAAVQRSNIFGHRAIRMPALRRIRPQR